jgi:hypothetical protein
MAETLCILNGPPYGTERNLNALWLAASRARTCSANRAKMAA